jgi:hypothetical protein
MPERRFDLLERLVGADPFAQKPAEFAGSPARQNGRIL